MWTDTRRLTWQRHTENTHTHTHKHRLLNRPKMPWNNQNTSDICVDYNLATLSIVFKHGLIGCIFVLEHNFLQLEHDSLSKQRRSLTPRSHHVSFTSKLAWPATGGKHRSTLTCLPKTQTQKQKRDSSSGDWFALGIRVQSGFIHRSNDASVVEGVSVAVMKTQHPGGNANFLFSGVML